MTNDLARIVALPHAVGEAGLPELARGWQQRANMWKLVALLPAADARLGASMPPPRPHAVAERCRSCKALAKSAESIAAPPVG